MINIAICDDHKIVREGLKHILQEYNDIEVCCDLASGEDLFGIFREQLPDILILDISLSGRSGLDILKQLKLLYPELKVLILSMYPEDQFAIRVFRAGASGYLHKDSSPEILLNAIRTIAKGEKYLNPSVSALLVNEINSLRKKDPHELLSDREYDVMMYIGKGRALSEIANIMTLSIKTISTYRTRLMQKLNFNSNAEIIKYLIENDLIDTE